MMKGMWHFSHRVYCCLNNIIGRTEVIKMRREIADLLDLTFSRHTYILSGSQREGFRFQGSDYDIMYWLNTIKVVFSLQQLQHYSESRIKVILLLDTCYSRPGFALLQCLSLSTLKLLPSGVVCINIEDKLYISSSKVSSIELLKNSFLHGPCRTSVIENKEIDLAFCFHCQHWPPFASEFIDRCRSNLWPSSFLLQDIVNGGCHFVPIGAKGSAYENHEWRISFSVAEQKLIYSMNHTQFLCYGLLKVFLKDVINKDIENHLLCSYFMKSAVFWEIQIGCINIWCPQNLVYCFWKCFKRIIKWVYQGWCPNFFIPSNNMFQGKIVGSSQQQLFNQLYSLYEFGSICLLKSHSLNAVLNVNNWFANLDDEIQLSDSYFRSQVTDEISHRFTMLSIVSYLDVENVLKAIRQKKSTVNLSKNQILAIKAFEYHCQQIFFDNS